MSKFLQTDKLLHLCVSALLAVLFCRFMPMLWSAVAVLVIGVAKELIYDKWLGKGCFEWLDLFADLVGIMVGVLLVY